MINSAIKIVCLPCLISAFILIIGGIFVFTIEHRLNHAESARNLRLVDDQITTSFNQLIFSTESLEALFMASDEVTAAEFADFTTAIHRYYQQEGMDIVMGWIGPDNIVKYAHPITATNQQVIGLDLSQLPNRYQLLQSAKAAKEPQLSDPVFLFRNTPGFLVYNPVFKDNQYLGTAYATIPIFNITKAIHWQSRHVPNLITMVNDFYIDPQSGSIFNSGGYQIINPQNEIDPAVTISVDPNRLNHQVTHSFSTHNLSWQLIASSNKLILFSSWISLTYVGASLILLAIITKYQSNNHRHRQQLEQLLEEEHQHNLSLHHQQRANEEKTKEIESASEKLKQKTQELSKLNQFMLDRELQMAKMKQTIEQLKANQPQPPEETSS